MHVNESPAPQDTIIAETASQFGYSALNWVTSQIQSKLGNYLVSAIFGSGGPSVVTLSEEIYQRIESIINRQLDDLHGSGPQVLTGWHFLL